MLVPHGYRYSVYHRIVRMALTEVAAPFETAEVNPFTEERATALQGLHPFGRVPVLDHAGQ